MTTLLYKKDKWLLYCSCALQSMIGVTAIAGGLRLVMNPAGTQDIPIDWLHNSPFSNYLIPGLVLAVVIGLGNVYAGFVSFLRRVYSGSIAIAVSLVLIGFMFVELWYVGLRNFLQPLYLFLGLILLLIGMKLNKSIVTNK